ncbi:Gfo/Idh/MocA family protein [Microcella alkaliphila]|uniref:Oxidoreductase domain protein n=1 Tax=Microcella alkaliphila TaxID=279828 RepID=A0A0U4WTJ4_9MICO|nr:Gfo/Idh/MocA family oxidoreductase [Microcella alkaliphila]BAU31207.1 oxidoreductase domain protein [Microcella alkaliphila]
MNGVVGVGVIGAGVISTQYLDNLTAAADVDVRMIADLDVGRAAERARAYQVPAYGTVDELLARDDIEVMLNLTIPAAHATVAHACLDAGKHVWSEKPLALDLDEGTALVAHAARRGLRVACAPDTVLGGGVQTARRLIEQGVIGDIVSALTMFQVSGPESWHPSPEFLYARGGGPLFDMGPYYLSALVHLLGPVSRVDARGTRARHERVIGLGPKAGTAFPVEVATGLSALYEFRDGPIAQSTFSFESARPRVGVVEITGTDGTLCLPDPNLFDGEIDVWRPGMHADDEPERYPAVASEMTRGLGVIDLARSIRANTTERASGQLALHVLDIMHSTAESADRREPVTLTTTAEAPPLLAEGFDPWARTL